MRVKGFMKVAIVGSVLIASGVGAATVEQTIKARHANFKSMGKSMKLIGDDLKGGAPSIDLIRTNARNLRTLSARLPAWFPPKTGPESGIKTEARAEIWTDRAKFRAAAVAAFNAAKALDTAAMAGDMAKIGPALGALGGTCKGCHDSFRAKD